MAVAAAAAGAEKNTTKTEDSYKLWLLHYIDVVLCMYVMYGKKVKHFTF